MSKGVLLMLGSYFVLRVVHVTATKPVSHMQGKATVISTRQLQIKFIIVKCSTYQVPNEVMLVTLSHRVKNISCIILYSS